MTQGNKLNAAVLMFRARHTMTIKKLRRLIVLSISLFRTATKILLSLISRAAWQHRYNSTKVGHWRKDVLEGHAPFQVPSTLIFFCKSYLHDWLNSFLLPIFVFETTWEDRNDLVFCFLGCVVKFPTRRTANSWRRKPRSKPSNWVCICFSFFPFLPF